MAYRYTRPDTARKTPRHPVGDARSSAQKRRPEYDCDLTEPSLIKPRLPRGLVNQAATCYLNSLMQALYMTPEFRNALYRINLDVTKDPSRNLVYNTQQLFRRLQTDDCPVTTEDITRCLGTKVFEQRDVQEFWHELFDQLQRELMLTGGANLIKDLYTGQMKDYVICNQCGEEVSKNTTYLDIPLVIKPYDRPHAYNSVDESLKAFVKPQMLDGDNAPYCDACRRKCSAKKGMAFITFPYILSLALMRFETDWDSKLKRKINDRVTFPTFMKLDSLRANAKFKEDPTTSRSDSLDPPFSGGYGSHHRSDSSQERESCTYELFAVLVHTGSTVFGHYTSFIKSLPTKQWYCFNDQTVTEISEKDLEDAFGGVEEMLGRKRKLGNAYMLMYRQVDKQKNKDFMKTADIPEHLQEKRSRRFNSAYDTNATEGQGLFNEKLSTLKERQHIEMEYMETWTHMDMQRRREEERRTEDLERKRIQREYEVRQSELKKCRRREDEQRRLTIAARQLKELEDRQLELEMELQQQNKEREQSLKARERNQIEELQLKEKEEYMTRQLQLEVERQREEQREKTKLKEMERERERQRQIEDRQMRQFQGQQRNEYMAKQVWCQRQEEGRRKQYQEQQLKEARQTELRLTMHREDYMIKQDAQERHQIHKKQREWEHLDIHNSRTGEEARPRRSTTPYQSRSQTQIYGSPRIEARYHRTAAPYDRRLPSPALIRPSTKDYSYNCYNDKGGVPRHTGETRAWRERTSRRSMSPRQKRNAELARDLGNHKRNPIAYDRLKRPRKL